jgi:xanthine dehydrogenase large subunit
MDLQPVLAAPGVVGVVTAQDIPGDPLLATFVHDETIFAGPQLMHVGQVMGLVVGHSHTQTRQAARLMKLQTKNDRPLLHAREAMQAGSFVLPKVTVQRGDTPQALAQAPHRLQGSLEIGGQEHFYLESQIAYAIPQENGLWLIHSGTQHPGEVQHWVAHALHIPLAHGRRLWRQRNPGRAPGRVGRAGRAQVWSAGQDAAGPGRRHPDHRQTPPFQPRLASGL